MPEFYKDLNRPDVEHLARAICIERGIDPDSHTPETGTKSADMIPWWWKFQDRALDFIAMQKAVSNVTVPDA